MHRRILVLASLAFLTSLAAARADSPVIRLDLVAAEYGNGLVPASGQILLIPTSGAPFDTIIVVSDSLNGFADAYRFTEQFGGPGYVFGYAIDRRNGNANFTWIYFNSEGIYEISSGGITWYVAPAGP
jgi:hypothetical protein